MGSMVFRWFSGKTTIGNDGFRWLCTIGPTMEWLCTIVEVYIMMIAAIIIIIFLSLSALSLTSQKGEGVINPRHECASNYVCCIFPLTARCLGFPDLSFWSLMIMNDLDNDDAPCSPATGQCGVSRVAR